MMLVYCGIYGAAAVLAAALMRKLLRKRMPAWVWPCLWLLVGVRFLVPLWLPVEVPDLLPEPVARTEAALQAFLTAERETETVSETTAPADSVSMETAEEGSLTAEEQAAYESWRQESDAVLRQMREERGRTEEMISLRTVLARIWLAGSVLVLGYFALSYLHMLRIFRAARPCESPETLPGLRRKIRFRQTDRIDIPLTYGILRPVILLPENLLQKDLLQEEYRMPILLHEWNHVRSFDGLRKLFFCLTAAVHWWNPAAWLYLRLAGEDLEFACDARTVAMLHGDGTVYARSLLYAAERQGRQTHVIASGFGRTALRRRILQVLEKPKRGWVGAALLLLVTAVLVCCAPVSRSEPAPVPDSRTAREEEIRESLRAEMEWMEKYQEAKAEEESLDDALKTYLAEGRKETEEIGTAETVPADAETAEMMLTALELSRELQISAMTELQQDLEELRAGRVHVQDLYDDLSAQYEAALKSYDELAAQIGNLQDSGQEVDGKYHQTANELWDQINQIMDGKNTVLGTLGSYDDLIELVQNRIALAEKQISAIEQQIRELTAGEDP